MAEVGERTTDVAPGSISDDVLAHRDGSLIRQTAADLATQLAGSGAVAEELSTLRSQITSGMVAQSTWTALSALAPAEDGTGGEVLESDAGSHADATATGYDGATVDNAGRYAWNLAWARWVRIGDTGLAAKADLSHSHTIGDVTGLQTALDGKAASAHGHTIGDVTGLQTALDAKAASAHGHSKADVGLANVDNTTDLQKPISTATQAALNAKANLTAFNAEKVTRADAEAQLAGQINEKADADDVAGALEHLETKIVLSQIADGTRPGETVTLFSNAVSGAPETRPAKSAGTVVNSPILGAALRISGADINPVTGYIDVVPKTIFPIEPGRIYEVRQVFARAIDSGDPAGDAVQPRWTALGYTKGEVGNSDWGLPLTPAVADGRIEELFTVSIDGVTDLIVPPATRYLSPALRIWGAGQSLDGGTISVRDITGLGASQTAKHYIGGWDAGSGTFPGGGTAAVGDTWDVTGGGTVDGVAFAEGQQISAIAANASTSSAADWQRLAYLGAVTSVNGMTGAVTGLATLTGAETLEGKTLAAPVIVGGRMAGWEYPRDLDNNGAVAAQDEISAILASGRSVMLEEGNYKIEGDGIVLRGGMSVASENGRGELDLSRICAAPSARLGHFPFEGDRAFPAQC